jgi:hypothetical protein
MPKSAISVIFLFGNIRVDRLGIELTLKKEYSGLNENIR